MGLNFKDSKFIIYAPMAGISDSPSRKIAKSLGAQVVFSGLISAEAIIRNSPKTLELAAFDNLERPIGLQLFGARPAAMGLAARMLEKLTPDFIDINFGCPAPKIVGKNGGSSILKDLGLMKDIISAVISSVSLPVTVKIRAGWDSDSLVYIEAGKIIEDCGAAAITLHPRTKIQAFTGKADWEMIARLKQAVKIPVIGNGDIFSQIDAKRMFAETGCDAVMVGRGSLGNPWIFNRIRHYLDHGEMISEPSFEQKIDMAIRHFNMMIDHYPSPHGVYKMRTQFCWYLKGIPGSAEIKTRINHMLSPLEIIDLLNNYKDSLSADQADFGNELTRQAS